LDHMLDQLNSHGQLRVSVQASQTPAGELLLNFWGSNKWSPLLHTSSPDFWPWCCKTSLFMEAAIFGFRVEFRRHMPNRCCESLVLVWPQNLKSWA
jgi:hypothetical protein